MRQSIIDNLLLYICLTYLEAYAPTYYVSLHQYVAETTNYQLQLTSLVHRYFDCLRNNADNIVT